MQIYYCDRCGKKLNRFNKITFGYYVETLDLHTIELCGRCYKDLKKLLKLFKIVNSKDVRNQGGKNETNRVIK